MSLVPVDAYALLEVARKEGPNPFKQKPIVSQDEVWGEVTTNLSNLNEHVDQEIDRIIFDVRNRYTSKIGILLKGDVGTGKSHVIHRIWKRIEQKGDCIFSYIPPYSQANRINSHVRLYLAESLRKTDSNGISQWQKLASAIIRTLDGTEFGEEYRQFIERCDDPEQLRKYILVQVGRDKQKQADFFEGLVEAILENTSKLDSSFLKSALFLLLKTAPIAQIGLAWIIGEDFPGTKEVGLPEFTSEQQDAKSLWMIQQICALSEVVSQPILICFDQLDCAPVCNDSGDSPAMVIAKCIDQIYFQCSNVILLCCALTSMWSDIVALGGGISERVGQRIVTTKPPTADQMIELIKLRLDWFYQQKGLDPKNYHPLYPFNEGEIRNIAKSALSSRDLMKWCAKEFEKTLDAPVGQNNKQEFVDIYQELLQRISLPDKDDDQIASVLETAMRISIGETISGVQIHDIETFNLPSHGLHFIVSAQDVLSQKEIRIGVRVCETKTARTFNAVMKRLVDFEKHHLTRGCLIRSSKLASSWKVGIQLKQQLEETGGEVVTLNKDELKPLVALQRIYSEAGDLAASQNGLSKEEVTRFAKELRFKDAAVIHGMAILNPGTLEKLVKFHSKYPIDLFKLKDYLLAGQTDDEVDRFIAQCTKDIVLRSRIISLVREFLDTSGESDISISKLHAIYTFDNPPEPLTEKMMREILLELASPLTGYLGRRKSEEGDRFYFLRSLDIDQTCS